MLPFAVLTFTSALLLFLVQPLMARAILPDRSWRTTGLTAVRVDPVPGPPVLWTDDFGNVLPLLRISPRGRGPRWRRRG
jgi:hypothetical protein